MVVQSAAGPDLGGIVTAPHLLCENRICMYHAKEIKKTQPRYV